MATPTTSTPPSSKSTPVKTESDSTSNVESSENNKADMPAGTTVESGESPNSKSSEKKDSEKKDAEKKDAEKKDAEKKDAERKDAEKKDAEKKDAERKDAEKKDAEKKDAEKKDAEKKDAEKKDAEKKDSEKKDSEKKDSEKKDSEKKDSSQDKSLNDEKPPETPEVPSIGPLKPPTKRRANGQTEQQESKRHRPNTSEEAKLLVDLFNMKSDEERKSCLRELYKQNSNLYNKLWKVHYGELSSEIVAQKQTSIRVLFNKNKMVEYWTMWGLKPPTIDGKYCLKCKGHDFSGGYLIVLTGEGMYCHVKCWEKYHKKRFDSQ